MSASKYFGGLIQLVQNYRYGSRKFYIWRSYINKISPIRYFNWDTNLHRLTIIAEKTKIGLMIRAGVMDKEMVQALGINVKAIFSFVFLLGAGMAALGGFLISTIFRSYFR